MELKKLTIPLAPQTRGAIGMLGCPDFQTGPAFLLTFQIFRMLGKSPGDINKKMFGTLGPEKELTKLRPWFRLGERQARPSR